MKKPLPLKIRLWAAAILALGGCGAVFDYARDNELRWGFLNAPKFISPARLRVGVLPFQDGVGLGAPEAGLNLARLLSEELAQDSHLAVRPAEEMAAALHARLDDGPLTTALVAQLGADLRLNAVIMGSVSEISSYSQRKGWRRLARFFTARRDYVDAVLSVSAVDVTSGIILVSRANMGEYDGGPGEASFIETGAREGPSQDGLEGSLDAALSEAAYRTLEGLAELPFKARVISAEWGAAEIAFGQDVGLKKGQPFVRLELLRTITNTIGETYQVMGAATARLKITDLGDHSATLEITEGQVYPGDIIQAVN